MNHGSLRFKIVEKAVISIDLVRLSSQKMPQSWPWGSDIAVAKKKKKKKKKN